VNNHLIKILPYEWRTAGDSGKRDFLRQKISFVPENDKLNNIGTV
jgi:hypothetical protein